MDGFEIIPFQGDSAARVWAGSLEGLFVQAARAMGAILTEGAIEPQAARVINLEATDLW